MKRLLLSLCLVGAAAYTFNTLDKFIPDGKAEDTSAGQTQPNHPVVRDLRSWGPYLPSQSLSQTSQQPAPLPPRQNGPRPYEENQPASEDKTASSVSDGAEQQPVEWAKVVLAAQVHSEASVSSPTVRFYRPGTKLRVVRRENGWLELSDPVTQERGWVFAKYLSSVDGPSPSATRAAREEPLPTKPALPSSKKGKRSAKPALKDVVVTELGPRSGRWARRGDGQPRVGLFMFGPFARF